MQTTVATEAKRTTLLVATLTALATLSALVFDPRDHADRTLFAVDLCHSAIAVAVGAWFARPRPHGVIASELGFTAMLLPFLVSLWMPPMADLRDGTLSEPMMLHHFLLLSIAIFSPTRRSGVVFLIVFTLHAVALGQALSGPALAREPWITLLFASVASLLLYTRLRRRLLEQRVDAAEERVRVLADVARMLLALRDRANTPLQTLEVGVSLLADDVADPEQLAIMQRALGRLASVQQMLSKTSVELAAIAGDSGMSPGDLEEALRELVEPG